jgi:hypothetical protein
MNLSPEEFFMYLTVGLIILIPISARLYRYVTMKRTKEKLQAQIGRTGEEKRSSAESG